MESPLLLRQLDQKIFNQNRNVFLILAKRNNLVNSFFENLMSFLFSKINITAISIVSLRGILVKRGKHCKEP